MPYSIRDTVPEMLDGNTMVWNTHDYARQRTNEFRLCSKYFIWVVSTYEESIHYRKHAECYIFIV